MWQPPLALVIYTGNQGNHLHTVLSGESFSQFIDSPLAQNDINNGYLYHLF